MKVTIVKLGLVVREVEVSSGASVGEAIDAAEFSFLGYSAMVNGLCASLGATLKDNDMVILVPKVKVEKTKTYPCQPKPSALSEEEIDDLFLSGKISVSEYAQRMMAFEESRNSNLIGSTLVFPKEDSSEEGKEKIAA
jgi:Tol biopolymer transport system component